MAVVAGDEADRLAAALGNQDDAVVGQVVAFDFRQRDVADLDAGAPVGMDTGVWELPFVTLMGFCVVGSLMAFKMHPERPFVEPGERAPD